MAGSMAWYSFSYAVNSSGTGLTISLTVTWSRTVSHTIIEACALPAISVRAHRLLCHAPGSRMPS
ncbi:hypothetical protein D3C85_1629230 [compost metagenome]